MGTDSVSSSIANIVEDISVDIWYESTTKLIQAIVG